MDELYAVFLESLDMELQVFETKAEAEAVYAELEQADKPVQMQKFEYWQAVTVEKSNGTSADDPNFWEEITYDNGSCKLVQTYRWHEEPEPEGYYPDYLLKF